MFSTALRTTLLLAVASAIPMLCTSCGGSGSSYVAASTNSLDLEAFLSGRSYFRIAESGVELRSNPTQIGSSGTAAGTQTVEGWLCLPSGDVYNASFTCTTEQADAVLEVVPELGRADTDAIRDMFEQLGIRLSSDVSDSDVAEQASSPIRYRIDVNNSTAVGITDIVVTTGSVDDSAHRQTIHLEANTSF